MTIPRQLIPTFWFIVFLQQAIAAPKGSRPNTQSEPALDLSLATVLKIALHANAEINVRAQDVVISEAEVERARSRFDPSLNFYANLQNGRRPSPYADHRPRGDLPTAVATAEVKKRIATGATIDLSAGYSLSQADDRNVLLNPLHSSKVGITVTQPLLRGAGIFINRSPILLAKNSNEISNYQFRRTVTETLVLAEAAYWESARRYWNLIDEARVLELARKLAADSEIRYEAGDISLVDLTQSRRVAAKRRVRYLEEQNAFIRSESKLKAITNYGGARSGVERLWRPTDSPQFREAIFSVEDEILVGLVNRSDFRAAKLDLENQNIHVKVARNALRPVLNLVGGVSFEGISGSDRSRVDSDGNLLASPYVGDAGDLFDRMRSGDGTQWNIGVVLKFPWGRRDEKGHYRQREAIARQAFERLVRAERSVIRETRTAIKIIEANKERYHAAVRNAELSATLVQKSFERLKLGDGETADLAIMLDELAEAYALKNQVLGDYVLSLTELEQATGTLLANRGISLSMPTERSIRTQVSQPESAAGGHRRY